MSLRLYRYFQACLLIALGIFLASKIVSNKLIWYINPRFIPLTVLAVFVLLFIGLVVLRAGGRTGQDHSRESEQEQDPGHEHNPSTWRLVVITLPLAVGVLIPAHPLSAAAMAGKGITSAVPITASSSTAVQFGQAADTRTILDWNSLFESSSDPSTYLGQIAYVLGFVYHDPNLKSDQFLVARFALVCCPADAFAVVMVVNWPQSASLPTNQWVKVKGPVQSTAFDGQTLPSIQAISVTPVQPPIQIYLYP